MNANHRILAAAVGVLMAAGTAAADGMIVPVRPDLPVRGSWSVKYHHVKIAVRDQVASVHIDQEFVNNGRRQLEVEYLFPIPPGAAIKGMTMVVDGKELTGKLMKADEARKIYESIVRKKKDPALLEYVGYGLYRTRAFPLVPGKPANVIVQYETLCRKDHDMVEVFYPLNTEKFSATKIKSVKVTVDIKARADITTVYSPTHEPQVERDKKDAGHVVVTYKAKNVIPDIDFKVYYRSADEKVAATVLSHRPDAKADGYFLALVSPGSKLGKAAAASKDIVVVLDHSGSMARNGKLDQAKEALKHVLSSLGEEDRFNVVAFCGMVQTFFPKLMDASKKNVGDALDLLARIEPSGATNIQDAVTVAMGLFAKDDRPGYILFLTDGEPTVKERDDVKLAKIIKNANAAKARMFALGVGYDVNARLLDMLVRDNRGMSDYVKPAEPLEAKITGLYNKIKRPVMTDLAMSFEPVRVRMTYPDELPDLFDGGQIVLVGRYDKGGRCKLKVTGLLEGTKQALSYDVTLDEKSATSKNSFVERLWAVRRIGFLLDQIQLSGESEEVIDELVKLSTTYGIMTPYTSFLADETTALGRPMAVRRRALKEAAGLAGATSGFKGQAAARTRGSLSRAPSAAAPGVPGGSGGAVRQWGHGDRKAYEAGTAEYVVGVRNVGNRTFFRRGKVWVTSATAKLDLVKDADKIKVIERFSKEYFDLVRHNTVEENQVFAAQKAGEELLVELRGVTYRMK